MINVLMVDDHKAMLMGTKMLLESHGMKVTAVHSGYDALEILKDRSFDINIYDLKMPDMNGIELSRKTLELRPESIILIFSGEDLAENFNLLVETGVNGMLEKSASERQLTAAIQMALEGMVVLPLNVVRQLRLSGSASATVEADEGLVEPLTDLELGIIQQAALGRTNKEISEMLNTVQRNVEYHLSSIYRKLNVSSRMSAVKRAIQLQLIRTK
jgi:two-component system competent response regulator ComA